MEQTNSAVGNACVGAKINGRIVPLNYQLKNGNIVEIITNPNSAPSLDWLKIVKSPQAKNKIKQYFKVKDKDKNIELGKNILDREIKRLGLKPPEILKEEWLKPIARRYRNNSIEDLYAAVGYGSLTATQIVQRLVDQYNKETKAIEESNNNVKIVSARKRRDDHGISVKGADNLKIRFAGCCNPVPGDNIIGYITMGRGISVHRVDCPNIVNEQDKSRFIEVHWDIENQSSYTAEIAIRSIDRGGILSDITNRINDSGVKLSALNARTNKEKLAMINVVLEIHDVKELDRLMERIRKVKGVLNVNRVTS